MRGEWSASRSGWFIRSIRSPGGSERKYISSKYVNETQRMRIQTQPGGLPTCQSFRGFHQPLQTSTGITNCLHGAQSLLTSWYLLILPSNSQSRNPKVHHRVHKSHTLVPILRQMNPVYILPTYLRSILILFFPILKNRVGLWDHVAVCVCVCLCIPLALLGNGFVKIPLLLLGNG
jgi:hypothetical protein